MKGVRIDYQPTKIETLDTDGRGIGTFTAIAIKEGPLPYKKVNRPPMPEHGLGNLPDVSEDELQWEHVDGNELTKPEVIQSLKTAPVTDGHPPDFVKSTTVEMDAAGLTTENIDLVENEVDEGENVRALRIRVAVFDQDLIQEIKSGTKQISTARKVDLIPESGTFNGQHYDLVQQKPSFNHVAILDSGRCGPKCSIMDGRDESVGCAIVPGISFDRDVQVEDVIEKRDDEWCILSEDGEVLECKETKEEAEQRLQEIEFFKNQDSVDELTADTLQETIDVAFTNLVESRIRNLQQDREQTLESIANQSNREVREVEAQIAGSVMPTDAVLRAISQVVGIPLEVLRDNLPGNQQAQDALADALGLSQEGGETDEGRQDDDTETETTQDETTDSTDQEVNDMAITVEVGDSEMTLDLAEKLEDLDCEDCQDVVSEIEDEFEPIVEALQTKNKKLEGRLEQATADQSPESTEDEDENPEEDETEDQPQPGGQAAPEAGGEGANMTQEEINKLINLVSLIREEQADYDPEGKSLMQVMMDALEILGGVNLENAFGSENAEDADIERPVLEGRVDQVMDAYMAKNNIKDVGEVKPNGDPKEETEDRDIDQEIKELDERLVNFREHARS